MEQPLVSVIVPVYNAEHYLGPCLESIRRQSRENIEVLLVNDGSKTTVCLSVRSLKRLIRGSK